MAERVLREDEVGVAAGVSLREQERKTLKAAIESLKPGEFTTLRKVAPHGALQARLLNNGGVRFYWRYTLEQKTIREPIGVFDARATPNQRKPVEGGGYSVLAAVVRATEMAVRHDEWLDRGGYPGYAKAQATQLAVSAAAEDIDSAAQATDEPQHDISLAALLRMYWEDLKGRGAPSWKDVKNALTNHVIRAFPDLAVRPAASITTAECAKILRRLNDERKGRTGNKVRSHLRSAFQSALGAEVNPKVRAAYVPFGIATNPVASIPTLTGANAPDKRPYRKEDLQRYWTLLKDVPGVKGAVLRLHLLAGAPRIQQFARLLNADIHGSAVVLYDTKGKETHVKRPYELPLPAPCCADIEMLKNGGPFAVSLDGGNKPISHFTISSWAQELVGDELPGFQLKRIRSSAQTLFNELKVPPNISGRIQSHGVGGVVARHYDGYEYREEKAQALAKFYEVVTGEKLTSNNRAGVAD